MLLRGAYVVVDLARIGDNVDRLIALARGEEVMAVVKADAYGHGAVAVAQKALGRGASWLGVATLSEAAALRQAGITAPTLVLGLLAPDEYAEAARLGVSVTISDGTDIRAARRGARAAHTTLSVHLKADTGLGRIGAPPAAVPELARLARGARLRLEGVFSHLADGRDAEYSTLQIRAFTCVLRALRDTGLLPPWRHLLDSEGLLSGHRVPGANLVRSGILIYGFNPDGCGPRLRGFDTALSLHARINLVKTVPRGTPVGYGRTYVADREVQIASLGVGYADGYRRCFSNRAQVLIDGRAWPLAGLVSMDQVCVAVDTGIPVSIGDEAVLIGHQGGCEVPAEELAALAGTLADDITAGLSPRLPRRYRDRRSQGVALGGPPPGP